MGRFHVIEENEIMNAGTTDIYFENTSRIIQKIHKASVKVVADFTVSRLPENWPWAISYGLEEILNLMKGKKIDLYALPEGTLFQSRTSEGVLVPLLIIEGPYSEFCKFETPILGLMCQGSGIATRTARLRVLAGDTDLLSFGIRRIHPSIAHMVDRACFTGGCNSVSCVASAERLGLTPKGTMPHALTVMTGSPEEAFRAYDKHLPVDVPRIALVDTYQDEISEAITACETVPGLEGVRLDTPASRRGNFVQLIQELRWELDVRGYEHVKIYTSGGITEKNITELVEAGVHGFGIGTTLVNAPVLDIAMDIVEKEGEPVAKRGKFSGRKYVYRCPKCMNFDIMSVKIDKPAACKTCGETQVEIMKKYLDRGRLVEKMPSAKEIRQYVIEQLKRIEL
jgi:nicotinate phosphoribosyltransferase